MGGSSGTTTTTQTNIPFNADELKAVQGRAVDLMNSNPINYYPGQSYANPSQYQTGGLQAAGQLGMDAGNATAGLVAPAQSTSISQNTGIAAGSGFDKAQPYLSDINKFASGDFMGSNPYLDSMYQAGARALTNAYQTATVPQIDTSAEAAGRFGSGANANAGSVAQQNLGKALGDMASNLYGSAYASDMANRLSAGSAGVNAVNSLLAGQQAAINATPTLAAQPAADYQTSINAGQGQQTLDQAILTDLQNRFYGNELAPWNTTQQAASIVGNAIPGTMTSQTPYYTNPMGQALGAGLGVAKLLK